MGTLTSLLLLTAITGQAGDTLLLDFYGTHCGPCKLMEPTVARLQASGYPVRKINVNEHPELAQQFRVNSVPCFVLISGGREVGRINNAVSHDVLVSLFQRVGYRPSAPPRLAQTASSGRLPRGFRYGNNATKAATAAVRATRHVPANTSSAVAQVTPTSFPSAPTAAAPNTSTPTQSSAQSRAFAASVRIKVDDANGHSFGTGTIIDVHDRDALVLTCGHIFRTSRGQGKIHVDVFVDGKPQTLTGELIAFEADRQDIGLISIKPSFPVTAAPIATSAARPTVGDTVFTIGCDHGADPSLQSSRITAINRYVGPANIEVAGQPVNGRSGGGLFAADGRLIGVCNAADDVDNEGIYAGLQTIHQQLASVGQQRLFQPRAPQPPLTNPLTPIAKAPAMAPSSPTAPPQVAAATGTSATGTSAMATIQQVVASENWEAEATRAIGNVSPEARQRLRGIVSAASQSPQVICVVPGSAGNGGKPEFVIVSQPSPELVRQIASESLQQPPQNVVTREPRWPSGRTASRMRAQSQR